MEGLGGVHGLGDLGLHSTNQAHWEIAGVIASSPRRPVYVGKEERALAAEKSENGHAEIQHVAGIDG